MMVRLNFFLNTVKQSVCIICEFLEINETCLAPSAGLHSSYAGHAGQIDPELRAALSPDCHMTPVFDERTFHSPVYHSPTHEAQGSLYRANTGTAALAVKL